MIFADMEYIAVKEWAANNGVSDWTLRNYCAPGKMEGAYLVSKTWNVPADAELPKRKEIIKISPFTIILRE